MPLSPEEEARRQELIARLGAPQETAAISEQQAATISQANEQQLQIGLTAQEEERRALLQARSDAESAWQKANSYQPGDPLSKGIGLDQRLMLNKDLKENSMAENMLIDVGAQMSKIIPNIKRFINPDDPEALETLKEIETLQDVLREAEPAAVLSGDVALPVLGALPSMALTGTGLGTTAAMSGTGALESMALTPSTQNPRTAGAIGAAAPFAAPLLGKLGGVAADTYDATKRGVNRMAAGTPKEQAANRIRDFMDEAGVEGQQVINRKVELGEGSTLADVDSISALGQGQAMTPSGQTYTDKFFKRKEGEQARIIKSLTDATGKAPSEFTGDVTAYIAKRANAAAPLFETAFQRPLVEIGEEAVNAVPDFMKRLPKLLRRLDAAGALQKAVDNAAVRGVPISLEKIKKITFRDLHAAKEGLDDIIKNESAKLAKEGGSGTKLANLTELRKEYRGMLKQQNPKYSEALSSYAGDSAVINAAELGANSLAARHGGQKLSTERLAREVAEMGESEIRAYQGGVVKAVSEKLEGISETAAAAQKFWRIPKMKGRLRTAFLSEGEFDVFLEGLRKESDFTRTLRNLYLGSQTAPRLAMQKVAGKSPKEGFAQRVKNIFGGDMRPAAQRELSRLMFDPTVTNKEIREIVIKKGFVKNAVDFTDEMLPSIRRNWAKVMASPPVRKTINKLTPAAKKASERLLRESDELTGAGKRALSTAAISPTIPRLLEEANNND